VLLLLNQSKGKQLSVIIMVRLCVAFSKDSGFPFFYHSSRTQSSKHFLYLAQPVSGGFLIHSDDVPEPYTDCLGLMFLFHFNRPI